MSSSLSLLCSNASRFRLQVVRHSHWPCGQPLRWWPVHQAKVESEKIHRLTGPKAWANGKSPTICDHLHHFLKKNILPYESLLHEFYLISSQLHIIFIPSSHVVARCGKGLSSEHGCGLHSVGRVVVERMHALHGLRCQSAEKIAMLLFLNRFFYSKEHIRTYKKQVASHCVTLQLGVGEFAWPAQPRQCIEPQTPDVRRELRLHDLKVKVSCKGNHKIKHQNGENKKR